MDTHGIRESFACKELSRSAPLGGRGQAEITSMMMWGLRFRAECLRLRSTSTLNAGPVLRCAGSLNWR